MSQKKTKAKTYRRSEETASAYMLKIMLFFILGTFWVRLEGVNWGPFDHFSIPVGFFIGLVFTAHEHFSIDQKIEYAILIVSTFGSYYLPVGIVIT